jgi:pimeloyl-ACP methyl ester carboxylesterase
MNGERWQHIAIANVSLEWFANEQCEYVARPVSIEEQRVLCEHLKSLENGAAMPVRGRDRTLTMSEADGQRRAAYGYTEWEYGVGVKHVRNDEARLFLMWEVDVEDFRVDAVSFRDLVQFVRADSLPRVELTRSAELTIGSGNRVLLLAHGYSPECGPNYPLINSLSIVAQRNGFKVIVPDFRRSYAYGHGRGRSERALMLLEELLSLDEQRRPDFVVIAGHSQGGAASAAACRRPSVVRAANVQGLYMIGSESPLSLHDGVREAPSVPHVAIVHASRDAVIGLGEIDNLVNIWREYRDDIDYLVLDSKIPRRTSDCFNDDVAHDFLSRDLLEASTDHFDQFLSQIVSGQSKEASSSSAASAPSKRRQQRETKRRRRRERKIIQRKDDSSLDDDDRSASL